MMLIILLALALVAGIAAIVACHLTQRGRASELPRDWWTDFEQQFRAYAARQAASQRRLES